MRVRCQTGSCRLVLAVLLSLSVTAGVAAEGAPDAPTRLAVSAMQGTVVSLTWDAPGTTTPDAYVLEGGLSPGEVLGSLPLSAASTSAQLSLAPGVYFVRVVALADGVRSAPSNEVQIVAGGVMPPTRADDLRAVVVGNGVSITWRQTFDGGAPDRVYLDAVGPLTGTVTLPPTGEFRAEGVPDGTYQLRLRASNASGTSVATPSVTITVPGLRPAVARNPSTAPGDAGLPIRYERFDATRLETLAARERLAEVVAGATSEFDAMLRLKEWVAAQFPHSDPNPYPPWDALVILDAIRAGITGGFCAQYSQVMLQSLAALGFPARYVEIGTTSNPYAHFPLEVWSNQFDKWVLLDIDYNLHYERNGQPLSALEVHDALVGGTASSVNVVQGAFRAGHPSPGVWPERTLELYYYLRIHLKANHVSSPSEPAFDRWNDMIEFRDARTVPWESSQVPSTYPKERLTRLATSDRAAVDAPLNQLWVMPRIGAAATVLIDLAHDMPQIVGGEYRVIDEFGVAGPWMPVVAPTIVWPVRPRERALEVRGMNLRGVFGPSSRVVLTP